MLLLGLSGPLACLLVFLKNPFERFLLNLRAYHRTTGALRRAQRACQQAKTPAHLLQATRCYLAERLGLSSGSALTPGDATAALAAQGIPMELTLELQTLWVQLEEALYRPEASLSLADSAKKLVKTLAHVDQEVAKCK
jgi:hypothetical protein